MPAKPGKIGRGLMASEGAPSTNALGRSNPNPLPGVPSKPKAPGRGGGINSAVPKAPVVKKMASPKPKAQPVKMPAMGFDGIY